MSNSTIDRLNAQAERHNQELKKHGGPRPNAGRKPTHLVQYITRLPQARIDHIRALAALQGVSQAKIVLTYLNLPKLPETRPTPFIRSNV